MSRGEGEGEAHTNGGGDRDVTDPFRASRLFEWGPLSESAPCLSRVLLASGYWLVLASGQWRSYLLGYP